MKRIQIIATVILCVAFGGASLENTVFGPRYGAWSTSCRVDPIDDRKTCFALNRDLVIAVSGKDSWRVIVGHRHDPRSLVYLRLDSKAAISTRNPGWYGLAADPILYDFRETKVAIIRYTRFVGMEIITQEISMEGINEALDFLIAQTYK